MLNESDLSTPSPCLSPSEALIRDARREDAASVVRMVRRFAANNGGQPTNGLPDLGWDVLGAEPWESALIAEAGPSPVGCALFERSYRPGSAERCLKLGSLFVEPAWRGQGIGRALVEGVLQRAQGLSCSRVVIGTAPCDACARRLCESLGFEPLPARGGYQTLISPALHPA